jgi:hypothetical protein
MKDYDRRIRCGVSELALEAFDPKFERSKEGRLVALHGDFDRLSLGSE